MNIEFDDGIQFGLGAFETIEIRNDEPVLLEWHLERLNKSLDFLKKTMKRLISLILS